MQQFATPQFRTKVIRDFWPRATEARARFEEFVGNPQSHKFAGPHQCWDYWYAPHMYSYLRTDPAKVLGRDLVDDFMGRLLALSISELGGMTPLYPWMSLHINGMRHEIHNDSCNGTYAYIFSLTSDAREFTGGETCVCKSGAFDQVEPRRNKAWQGFFEVIPPAFNQLLLMDDRLAHMVPVVQGTMNPANGRVCLTGHFV